MHYHNVLLVKALDKTDAKERVEEFLEKFHEKEWDWYELGGRWMWSDLIKKYKDNIVKPGTNFYWNRYHDEEVKGKKWKLVFPDGTSMMVEYGSDFEIHKWVARNPEQSEIIDGLHKNFFPILEKYRGIQCKNISEAIKTLAYYTKKKDKFMLPYVKRKYREATSNSRWRNDAYFWNIETDNQKFDIELIKKSPLDWYLVNVDLHN